MPKKPVRKNDHLEIELDAWRRFERAVDVVAKSPPQPKVKSKQKTIKKTINTKRKKGD